MGRAKKLPEPLCPLITPCLDIDRLAGQLEVLGMESQYDWANHQAEYGMSRADFVQTYQVEVIRRVAAWWSQRSREERRELLQEYVSRTRWLMSAYEEQLSRNNALELREVTWPAST